MAEMKIIKGYCFKCHAKHDLIALFYNDELKIGVYSCKECGSLWTISDSSLNREKQVP